MTAVHFELKDDIVRGIESAVSMTGKSRNDIVSLALEMYLTNLMQDVNDCADAVAISNRLIKQNDAAYKVLAK